MHIKLSKIIKIFFFTGLFLTINSRISFAQSLDPHNPGGAPSPAALQEAGITQVRVVLKDDQVTQDYVNSLQTAGIDVVGIINWEYGSNGAYPSSGPGGQNTSSYINNFVNNVIPAAYAQYGNLHAYQVWNEPDDANPAYSNSIKIMSAQNYGTLLGLSHAALHNLSGNTQAVISAGLVSGNLDYVRQMLEYGGTADGYAIHPYVADPNREGAIQEVINYLTGVNSTTGAPIWITEFGWETSDQAAQAAWLLQVYALQQDIPYLNSVMWYAFSDAQNPGFGLVDATGTPKLAFLALVEYLKGNPITNEEILLLLEKNFIKCTSISGQFIGYAVTQAQCALYKPCFDDGGNIIGYAFGLNLCKFQDDVKRMCGGLLDMEPITYMPEVVGHNLQKPFALSAAFGQDIDSTDEDLLVSALRTDLTLTASWDHPNLIQPFEQTFGSIDPSSVHYIKDRMDMDVLNIPLFTMTPSYKNSTIKGSYGIGSQPDYEFEIGRPAEDPVDYVKRIYKTAQTKGKEELGIKSDIPTLRFNACIQRIGCSAAIEGEKACIKKESAGIFPIYCTPDDPADQCVGAGRLFSFNGEILYEEPPEMQGLSRAYQNFLYDRLVRIDSAHQAYAPKAKYEKLMVNAQSTDGTSVINQLASKANTNKNLTLGGDSLNYDTNGIPYKAPTNPDQNESLFTSISKPNLAEAQSIDDQLNDGTYQTTTPENCQNMTALVENKGNFYAVKAWDTQPLHCAYNFDYSLDVTYYVNGEVVGGCHHDLIPSSTMPKYGESNPNTNNGAWGLSISDIGASGDAANTPGLNCSVPVVPTAGEVLSVDIRVVGNAPDGVPGCGGKEAFCSTGNLKIDTNRPESIDCRVCPTWAPPGMCQRLISEDIITQDECTNGDCKAGSVYLESDSPLSIGDSIIIPTVNMISAFGEWLATTLGISSTNCEYKKEPKYVIVDGTPVRDGEEKTGLDCRFNAQQYSIYVYPAKPFTGDFGQRSKNMSVNDSMFSIANYTDKYFDPENAKAPVNLVMSINERTALNGKGESAFEPGDILSNKDGFDTDSVEGLERRDNYFYMGFTEEGSSNRTMYLDYTLFRQPQASGYCLSQRFLTPVVTEDKKIPKSVANSGLCNFDFMPGNNLAYNQRQLAQQLLEEGNALAYQQYYNAYLNQLENIEVTGGRLAIDADKVLDNINENINTLDKKITEEKIAESIALKTEEPVRYKELSEKERNQLREEFLTDLENVLNKYKATSSNFDDLPPAAKEELNTIKRKFEKKLIVYNN